MVAHLKSSQDAHHAHEGILHIHVREENSRHIAHALDIASLLLMQSESLEHAKKCSLASPELVLEIDVLRESTRDVLKYS